MPNLVSTVKENEHIQGNYRAPIVLLEYGDYQCPSCGDFYPSVKQIQKDFGETIAFVFRHLPLKRAHPMAFEAACAAEAAARQGKFWEIHDYFFEHQRQLSSKFIDETAEKLNLDMQKFKSDCKDEAIQQFVEQSFQDGINSGVNGTPCFYINGERYDGYLSFDSLVKALTVS